MVKRQEVPEEEEQEQEETVVEKEVQEEMVGQEQAEMAVELAKEMVKMELQIPPEVAIIKEQKQIMKPKLHRAIYQELQERYFLKKSIQYIVHYILKMYRYVPYLHKNFWDK